MDNNKRVPYVITIICLIIGFMIAIQFQATKDPQIKDSRDLNELRVGLQKERERSQFLLKEMSKLDQLLYQYETSTNKEDQVTDIMEKELSRIKKLAGYEDLVGKGFIIRLEELTTYVDEDLHFSPVIFDDDLRVIVNELNAYGAKAISINGQRIITTTAIRNVGERILINTIPIQPPYEIRVIGDSDILISALKLAGLDEYFMVVNHSIVYEPKEFIRVAAFTNMTRPKYLQPVKEAN
ncbi:DUF881 domain-containing protein [Caldalkalibacillus mannanilyticus]|uniref:DUF881 domain-containing protein n=1 Tax=Caldalkalibacillus mannanilyticus TaxID=1418 RepID=UPI00046A938B|nr:DUF881 domain-containing protein [Caldalkalibacillus mannanilyticus]